MKKVYFWILVLLLSNLSRIVQAQEIDSIQFRIAQVEQNLQLWGKTHTEGSNYTISELMQLRNVPGVSIAVINNYELEWTKAYGLADNKTKAPVTVKTSFNAGSISKPMCTLGVLKLAEDGRIDLDLDINTYLTSWKYNYTKKQPITTYQLLTHTAGLPWKPTWLINKYRKPPSVVDMFEKYDEDYTQQIADPGRSFSYSNSAMAIAQMIVQDIVLQPYSDYMNETVFEPLQMNNTIYLNKDNESQYVLSSAHWKGGKRTSHYHPMSAEHGAGGLWTTPSDLAKYVIELQKGYRGISAKVISPESVTRIFTPAKQELPHFYTLVHGMNMFLENHRGEKYFHHAGEGSGHTALFMGGLENGKGLVVMANLSDFGLVYAIAHRIAVVYEWRNFAFNNGEPFEVVAVPEASKTSFIDKYQRIDYPDHEMTVSFDDNQLVANTWGGSLTCIPISQNKFWAHTSRLYSENDTPSYTTIEFLKHEDGTVNELILYNRDKETKWKKI